MTGEFVSSEVRLLRVLKAAGNDDPALSFSLLFFFSMTFNSIIGNVNTKSPFFFKGHFGSR